MAKKTKIPLPGDRFETPLGRVAEVVSVGEKYATLAYVREDRRVCIAPSRQFDASFALVARLKPLT